MPQPTNSSLRLERGSCCPELVVWVVLDDRPYAAIYFDEKADPYGAGDWCLSFCLPGSQTLSNVAHVFAGGTPYEALEDAAQRILGELADEEFPDEPERGRRLKAAVASADLDELALPPIDWDER
jgi:hypothetical protein